MRAVIIAILMGVVGAGRMSVFAQQTPKAVGTATKQPQFSSGDKQSRIPFELWQNEIVLEVRVGTSEQPIRLGLDSGSAATYLDSATAAKLGLHPSGSGSVHGAGTGAVAVEYLDDVRFHFPGLEWQSDRVNTTDLTSIAVGGHKIDGFLGYDFLNSFVVSVDYENCQMTISAPATFAYRGPGESLLIKFRHHWPYVPGTVAVPGNAPVHVELLVDSGSGDAVDDPVIKKSSGPKRTIRTGVGLGQPIQGVIGRGAYVQLGTYKLTQPLVACCSANPDDQHKIGGEILRRFLVIFDYPHARLILEPNSHFHDPFPNA
jgi:Aspartyl protease